MKHGSEERREQFLTKHETREQSENKRRRRKRDSKEENLKPSSIWASSSLASQLFKGPPLSILLK